MNYSIYFLSISNKTQNFNCMKIRLLLFLFCFSLSLITLAQTKVEGIVVDATTQKPLSGVNIKLKGTGEGTVSDAEGKFIINVSSGNSVLQFSFVGFSTAEVTAINVKTLTVALQPSLEQLQELTIVGSRNVNRTELTSSVPVDLIDVSQLQQTLPQYDVNQLLTYVAPSFNANRQSASDGTEHIDPASLRGLGPDQTLVLINGKRRHTTSLLNYQGTFGSGSVGTDLNAIPVSAIERIEVLRDGASAQYGSDAIAGVINVVLKRNTNLLNANLTGGITSRGDGELGQISLNKGLSLGNGGFLNVTGEMYYRGRTNRTQDHNLIIFDQSANEDFFAYAFAGDSAASRAFDDAILANRGLKREDFHFQVGDAQLTNSSVFYNLSLPFGGDNKAEFYSFGGLNYRRGSGSGFRRLPSETSNVVLSIFPNGFQPHTLSDIWDGSFAAGIKYRFDNGWRLDFSNTFGDNRFDYGVEKTNNASLGAGSPTEFDAGGHEFRQNTLNLDLSRYYNNIASGLNLAFGGEFRVDNYRIRQGEEASWRNYALVTNSDGTVDNPSGLAGGSQSFIGFSPVNEVNESRTNASIYADGELNVSKNFTLSLAGRFEDYSDFGSTINGKISVRFALASWLALRGAASTGFRAPSLHQQYFSYVSTDILPSGQLGQAGFFTNESPVARALGIPKLKEETSVNFSGGLTLNPVDRFTFSIDAYQVDVDDRIVLTGSFGLDDFGSPVEEIQELLAPFGVSTARFFTNAVNTSTQGIDAVLTYNFPVGAGTFDLTLAANFNRTEVDDERNIPAALVGQESIYFSPANQTLLEKSNPRQKINFGLSYTVGKITALVRNTYFGEVTRNGFPFGGVQEHDGKVVTDLSLGYQFTKVLSLTVGANNIFDVFPDTQIYSNTYFGVFKYAPVQMGTTGSFYFARLNLRFQGE
jgi:iron complex outermembrane receptor protein